MGDDRGLDNQCVLALPGADALQVTRNWSNNQFFVDLRQLATERDGSIPEDCSASPRASGECDEAPRTRRLAVFRWQACSAMPARAPLLAGGNPAKTKPSPPNPDPEMTARAALGPGTGSTRSPASCAAAISRAPGSETTGVPASDTTAMDSPPMQARDQARRFARLIVLVKARRRRRDRVVLKEPGRPACVLCCDYGHFAQDPQRAQRDILEIADRCRYHIQSAGHDSPGDCTNVFSRTPSALR